MPTVITHALIGAGLASLAPPTIPPRRAMLILATLAMAPDLDVVAFWLGIPYSHPLGHRGLSHSLLFAVIMAYGTCLLWIAAENRFSATWWKFFSLALIVAASHGILDAATNGGRGVGLFIPFTNARLFFDFRPIQVVSLNPARLLTPATIRVILSEIVWVWLPAGLCLFAARRLRPAASPP